MRISDWSSDVCSSDLFGVTTAHDPSNTASEDFAAAEMQRAGLILMPRAFSSGEIVYGAKAPGRYAVIDNYDEARAHVHRLKVQGAHSIKDRKSAVVGKSGSVSVDRGGRGPNKK